MIPLLFYYLVLPFAAAAMIIRFIRRYGSPLTPKDVLRLCREQPLEKGTYRVLRRSGNTLSSLGDFETHEEAVDSAFLGRHTARNEGLQSSFYVVNQKAEILDQFDS